MTKSFTIHDLPKDERPRELKEYFKEGKNLEKKILENIKKSNY